MRAVGVNIGLALACTFLLTGCATVVAQLDPQLVSERLPFVQDGKTSKEEVLRRLGKPDHRYEEGRILTYTILYSERMNNLIFVFGPDALVERHSVVLVK
jgi:hypothetical protein